MKAVILAGGRGKRLKQITDYVPKPLIPLNNVPILEWQIRFLKKFGIKEVVICTGYKTDQIENYLNVKNNFGIKIHFSIEKKPLGTGGAIKNAKKFLNEESFFVMNGDVITNLDLKLLKSKPNSIAIIPLKTKFGVVETSNDKISKFSEKKEISELWMNAGIYHLTKELIKDLPKKGDIEKTTFPKYSSKGKLYHVKFRKKFWFSIDSYKDMEECSQEMKAKNYSKYVAK